VSLSARLRLAPRNFVTLQFDLCDLLVSLCTQAELRAPREYARDLWAGKDLGALKDTDVFTIPRHGAVMLKLTK
jgi:hypothetical protein